MARIFGDIGHDDVLDPGAIGYNGSREAAVALAVGQFLREILIERGHEVKLSREAPDADVNELWVRVEMAKEWAADIFVSIHCNSFSDPGANGAEVFTTRGQDASDPLATAIYNALQRQFPNIAGRPDWSDGDPDKEAGFAVLKGPFPSVLVELAFISNPEEELLLTDPANQRLFAQAIADGIQEYLG